MHICLTPCLVLNVQDAVCDVFRYHCTLRASRVDSSLIDVAISMY